MSLVGADRVRFGVDGGHALSFDVAGVFGLYSGSVHVVARVPSRSRYATELLG